MNEQELKDFIGIVITDLKGEINKLSTVVREQNDTLHNIEIKSVTRVAELQKDIDELRRDVVDVRTEQRSMDESQKLKWKSLEKERADEKRDQSTKDEKQAVVNNGLETINKLL